MSSRLSCFFLRNGLTLWPDNRMTPCCLGIYNDLKTSRLSMQSNRNSFNVNAWRGLINEAHAGLAQGEIPPECRGCPQLRPFPRTDTSSLSFKSVNIINSRKCNLACNFCYLKKEFRESDASFNPHIGMFHDLVAKKLITPQTIINWGGGEPALHPRLKELYELFALAGCRQHFDTNATIYMDFLEKDLASGRTTLSCSLITPDPDTYKRVMGSLLCERAWQNAKRYAATGGDVRAKFIMLPENINQEEPFTAKCKEYGISILNLDREIYTTSADKKGASLSARTADFIHAAATLGIDLLNGVTLGYSDRRFFLDVHNRLEKKVKDNIKKYGVKKRHITLQLLGKNQNALAGQIFLLGVLSDIEPVVDMRHLNITEPTEWRTGQYSYFSEQYYYFTDSLDSQLSFTVYHDSRLVLRFISNEWSGIARIRVDDEENFIIDLYEKCNKHLEIDILKKNITSYKRLF